MRKKYPIETCKDILLKEEIKHMYPDSSFKKNFAYFVNIDNGKIYKLKNKITHTKAIVLDASRGGKKFGIKREEILPILKNAGYSSLIDYLKQHEEHFNEDILLLACRKRWIRITIGHNGDVYGQAERYSSVAVAFQYISKKWPITGGMVENFSNRYFVISNESEGKLFMNSGNVKHLTRGS